MKKVALQLQMISLWLLATINLNNAAKQIETFRYFSILCLSPGYIFKSFQRLEVNSIILSSGTLSPLDSLEWELRTKFEIKLENEHVICKNHILFASLSWGINEANNFKFIYTKNKNEDMFVELGISIEIILKHVPDGALIFFPSYTIMDNTLKVWKEKEIYSRIDKHKKVFVEPHK